MAWLHVFVLIVFASFILYGNGEAGTAFAQSIAPVHD